MRRVQSSIIVGIIGGILGAIGAFGVWGFIYGIGGSVISDRTYYELASTVELSGLIIGAISGALIGLVHSPMWQSAVWSILLAMVCVLGGCVGGTYGWQIGLAAFFWPYFMAMVVCVYFLIRNRL